MFLFVAPVGNAGAAGTEVDGFSCCSRVLVAILADVKGVVEISATPRASAIPGIKLLVLRKVEGDTSSSISATPQLLSRWEKEFNEDGLVGDSGGTASTRGSEDLFFRNVDGDTSSPISAIPQLLSRWLGDTKTDGLIDNSDGPDSSSRFGLVKFRGYDEIIPSPGGGAVAVAASVGAEGLFVVIFIIIVGYGVRRIKGGSRSDLVFLFGWPLVVVTGL